MREISFKITVTDEDLKAFGIKPEEVDDLQFKAIIDNIEEQIQEEHFGDMMQTALENILSMDFEDESEEGSK